MIRLGLFAVAYPITSRIGLKTNWRETLFQVHGGLRGAVGVSRLLQWFGTTDADAYTYCTRASLRTHIVSKITLAIALDNNVREKANDEDYQNIYVEETQKAFAFIGGIAFLTLSINGITAGPLLRKLGLADSTESREKIVSAYQAGFKAHLTGALLFRHCSWFCF